MGRNNARAVAALGLAATLLGVAACSGGAPDASEDGGCPVRIGFVGALSGGNVSIVEPVHNAAKLAFKQFQGGQKGCGAKLVPFDTQGDPAKAVLAAEKIVEDGRYAGVIGGAFSGETRAIKQTFDEAGVTMISASATATDLTAKDPAAVFHRVVGHDEIQGAATAKYLTKKLRARAIFVVDDGTAYGGPLGTKVKQLAGGAVVGSDQVQERQTDFTNTVRRIKAANPDVVYYAGYTSEASPFLKQLRDGGVGARFIGSDGLYGSEFAELAGERGEGGVITCPCVPPEKAAPEFAADYEAEYDIRPGAYAAEAFDAATVFLDAVKASKTTREQMEAYVDGYDKAGISKHIKFDDQGDVARDSVVIWTYRLEDGELVPHEEITLG